MRRTTPCNTHDTAQPAPTPGAHTSKRLSLSQQQQQHTGSNSSNNTCNDMPGHAVMTGSVPTLYGGPPMVMVVDDTAAQHALPSAAGSAASSSAESEGHEQPPPQPVTSIVGDTRQPASRRLTLRRGIESDAEGTRRKAADASQSKPALLSFHTLLDDDDGEGVGKDDKERREEEAAVGWWQDMCSLDESRSIVTVAEIHTALRPLGAASAEAFYMAMVRALHAWRVAHWQQTMVLTYTSTNNSSGNDSSSHSKETRASNEARKRRSALQGKTKASDAVKTDDESKATDAAAATAAIERAAAAEKEMQAERALAVWYEAGRIERLMAHRLLHHILDTTRGEPTGTGAVITAGVARRLLLLLYVVDMMSLQPEARPFRLPVTEREAPGYHKVVREPVSLDTLYGDVYRGSLPRPNSMADTGCGFAPPWIDYIALRERMAVMQHNCHLYNGAGSTLGRAVNALLKAGHAALRDAQARESEREPAGQPNNNTNSDNSMAALGALQLSEEQLRELFPCSALLMQPTIESHDEGSDLATETKEAKQEEEKQKTSTPTAATEPAKPSTAAASLAARRRAVRQRAKKQASRTQRANSGKGTKAEPSSATQPLVRRVLTLGKPASGQAVVAVAAGGSSSSGATEAGATRRTLLLLPATASAAATTTTSSGSNKKPHGHASKQPKRSRKRRSHASGKAGGGSNGKEGEGDKEVVYWMLCDRCKTWRVVPAPLDPLPEYWECANIGLPCNEHRLRRQRKKQQQEKQKKAAAAATSEGSGKVRRQQRGHHAAGTSSYAALNEKPQHHDDGSGAPADGSEGQPVVKKLRLTLSHNQPASTNAEANAASSLLSTQSQSAGQARAHLSLTNKTLLVSESTESTTSSTSDTTYRRGSGSSSSYSSRSSSSSGSSSGTSSSGSALVKDYYTLHSERGGGRGRGRGRGRGGRWGGIRALRQYSSAAPAELQSAKLTLPRLEALGRELEEVEAMAVNSDPQEILRRLRQLERELN